MVTLRGTPSTISTTVTSFPILPPLTDPPPGPDVEPGPSEDPDPEPGEEDPQTSDLPPTDSLPLGFAPDADDLRPTDPVGGTSSHSFTPGSTAITEPRLDVQTSKLRDPRLHDSRADKAETRAQNDERDGAPSFANIASELGRELDRLRRAVEYDAVVEQQIFGSSIALTAGLSIGYVVWLTRGGLLIASMVSSMPVWRLIDPVPILAGLALSQDEDDDGGESLGSILDGATTEQTPGEPGEAGRGAGENGAGEPGELEPI